MCDSGGPSIVKNDLVELNINKANYTFGYMFCDSHGIRTDIFTRQATFSKY